MRRLILLRHAKAEPRSLGLDDFDRGLTERGRRDATLMGKVLAREGLVPDLALVSPARRTEETWRLAAEAFPTAREKPVAELYDAPPMVIREAIDEASGEAEALIVVGHNPGLHEVAVQLMIEAAASSAQIGKVAQSFPTATVAAFLVDATGRPSFDGLFLAKNEGGEGGA
jgi:phosphohistidine phosphatase